MKYFFSGPDGNYIDSMTKNILLSYINKGMILKFKNHTNNMIIDSGAFSVYASGKTIDLNEYLDFCIKLQEEKPDFTFVNLDVIPENHLIKTMNASAEESLKNFLYMKKYIKNLMPIYHLPEDYNFYIEYLKHTDYIGVGVKENKRKNLDNFFRKWNKNTKIHGMGISGRNDLIRYPFYSVDSTSWFHVSIKQEKGKRNLMASSRLSYLVIEKIKEFIRLEKEITYYWKKRGIEWGEL